MKKFIFTFGLGHELGRYYQPIFAKTESEAREKMFEVYGRDWCTSYTEDDWLERVYDKNRTWEIGLELEPLYADPGEELEKEIERRKE